MREDKLGYCVSLLINRDLSNDEHLPLVTVCLWLLIVTLIGVIL